MVERMGMIKAWKRLALSGGAVAAVAVATTALAA
jgi:hypothetical protein